MILDFIKKETVFTIAILMAVVSVFFVTPDSRYLDYIDFRTLLLLFCLMAVMAGLQEMGIFLRIGQSLLSHTKSTRALMLILVLLPFFFSMLITNDVALITFVPFAIIVLKLAMLERLLIPLVILQTIAANLGSMLMPMGNPQNLYLFTRSGMSLGNFIALLLPYSLVSLVCIILVIVFMKSSRIEKLSFDDGSSCPISKIKLSGYILLFALCLLCVLKVLNILALTAIVFVFLLVFDRGIFKNIDYSLLGTFIGFFIFIGNMGRIEAFNHFIKTILEGHEVYVSILSSQVISNVPAALLLSGFTDNWPALIIGTNLGGLGTLIASMASLISYKQIARQYSALRGKYLLYFTGANIIMLGVLFVAYVLM